jgi:hypothetical protein
MANGATDALRLGHCLQVLPLLGLGCTSWCTVCCLIRQELSHQPPSLSAHLLQLQLGKGECKPDPCAATSCVTGTYCTVTQVSWPPAVVHDSHRLPTTPSSSTADESKTGGCAKRSPVHALLRCFMCRWYTSAHCACAVFLVAGG